MRLGTVRVVVVAACVLSLAGCVTSGGPFSSKKTDEPQTTGSIQANADQSPFAGLPPVDAPTAPGLLGSDPHDDLNTGKKQFRAGNFGLAERYFRRAVETHPADAEAWIGLAASYDRLRRFDLADRAYAQALKILGPTPELLNNQGFSYMLRGDYPHASEKLRAAQASDPANPHIKANIQLLQESYRQGKAIQ